MRTNAEKGELDEQKEQTPKIEVMYIGQWDRPQPIRATSWWSQGFVSFDVQTKPKHHGLYFDVSH